MTRIAHHMPGMHADDLRLDKQCMLEAWLTQDLLVGGIVRIHKQV